MVSLVATIIVLIDIGLLLAATIISAKSLKANPYSIRLIGYDADHPSRKIYDVVIQQEAQP